ncbi:hypothetical protein FHS26_004064 [Rhizobium pisi]|uniref:Uncharacterized protein n=1 Tax=Rhizobium pisi TaxID=574561 RepID=A0A3R9C9R6_9HYPH|nr:hypothetical protein [Rhizobium pisi]MBB3136310.1 hypothetical protein [Rhizobium pisi]RSB72044.1 hypothetical protein EFD55_20410 [Rhizobium pisi]TCA51480.1 hypothetical protein E0J16_20740 [Rhizobium pisi]
MFSHLSRLRDGFRQKLPNPDRSDRLLSAVLIFLMCLMLVLFARHAIAEEATPREIRTPDRTDILA